MINTFWKYKMYKFLVHCWVQHSLEIHVAISSCDLTHEGLVANAGSSPDSGPTIFWDHSLWTNSWSKSCFFFWTCNSLVLCMIVKPSNLFCGINSYWYNILYLDLLSTNNWYNIIYMLLYSSKNKEGPLKAEIPTICNSGVWSTFESEFSRLLDDSGPFYTSMKQQEMASTPKNIPCHKVCVFQDSRLNRRTLDSSDRKSHEMWRRQCSKDHISSCASSPRFLQMEQWWSMAHLGSWI